MTDLLLLVIAIALLVIAIASVLMLRYQGLQWRAHLDLKPRWNRHGKAKNELARRAEITGVGLGFKPTPKARASRRSA